MWFWLLALGLSSAARACEPATPSFACKADEAHFSIVVDSVQTTLSKDDVRVTVEQLPSHQSASIQNLTERPLYTVGEHPLLDAENATPYFIRDKKKWFVEGRYTSEKTSCVPMSSAKGQVKDPANIAWDCRDQETTCNEVSNTNVLYLPTAHYPLEWAANGLVSGKIALPKIMEQKFTQYFLHENKIEKVSLVSTVSPNEDYLKVTCDENAKIESCGKDCELFENLTVAIKNPSSAKFPIKTEDQDFSELYEVELFVDQDFKSRLVDAGGILVKDSIEALGELLPYGDLRKRPLDFIILNLAKQANDDLIPIIGQGWKFNLRLLPAQSQKRAPSASPPKTGRSK